MPEELEQVEVDTFYDDIRADIETAVTTYATLMEIDVQMQAKSLQAQIKRAKEDCLVIMCRGLEILREGYEKDEE